MKYMTVFSNSNTYVYNDEGQKLEDKKSKKYGEFSYANGNVYKGEWIIAIGDSDNLRGVKPHGNGKLTYANGAYYDGEWLHGKPHGDGIRRYPKGNTHNGVWRKGRRCGPGVYKTKTKVTLSATWNGDQITDQCYYKDCFGNESYFDIYGKDIKFTQYTSIDGTVYMSDSMTVLPYKYDILYGIHMYEPIIHGYGTITKPEIFIQDGIFDRGILKHGNFYRWNGDGNDYFIIPLN